MTTTSTPTKKVFKDQSFWAATFLGGPLAAGYLFAENYKAVGLPDKAKTTWIITLFSTLIIFGGAFLIPDDVNLPGQVIPIAYTFLASALFKKYQRKEVEEYVSNGGEYYKWWKSVIVGLISLAITAGILFGIIFGFYSSVEENYVTKSYGATVRHEIEYEANSVTENEVDLIADALTQSGFFDLVQAKYILFEKTDDVYIVYISVIAGSEDDQEVMDYFAELQEFVDSSIPTNAVEIKIVVDSYDNVVKVLD